MKTLSQPFEFDPTAPMPANPASEELWDRACRVIPGGTQTFSKGPTQLAPGVAPKFLIRGSGSKVWDADGHQYIDYTMGLLPLILGYAHPAVNEAVAEQLSVGSTFSLMHPLEVEVAELLIDLIPCAEMVRFGKNGSDATTAAVRLARAATGRDIVASCGYHGWHDWYIGTTTRNLGVPKAVADLTKPFPYNNISALGAIFDANPGRVAAVIMEPMTFEEPSPGYLEAVHSLTRRHGALLVFDEIVTGFRLSLGGAQARFGVTPDLATFGKAVANGFPLSAVVGSAALMSLFDEVFFSSTFGGEAISLAASKATLRELVELDGPSLLDDVGARLKGGCEEMIATHALQDVVTCPGMPVWTCLAFAGPDPFGIKTLFQQECLRGGVLFMANHNTSLAHSHSDIDYTLEAYDRAFAVVAEAVRNDAVDHFLQGPRVEPVFRTYE